MSYFEKLPLTVYSLNDQTSVVRDILRRARFASEYKNYTDLYEKYTIESGETPQLLANRYYNSPFYHWVILLTNEIHNPYFDWPLDEYELVKFCEHKYGADVMFKTKHFKLNGTVVGEVKTFVPGQLWIEPTFTGLAVAVSFYEYEQEINDAKREISILRPELLGEFVKQFEEQING